MMNKISTKDIKDILITNDGTINEEAINHYIESYQDVDARYKNCESKYTGQTLLCAAITHDEISTDTKIRLVSYLINRGALATRVGTQIGEIYPKHDELIDAALEEKNFEAAYLLLKEGGNDYGSFYDFYAGKNLIDVALDKKDEEIFSWILKNAPFLFSKLKTDKFNDYYKRILQIFPNFENSENYPILKHLAEERIDNLFTQLGLIQGEDMALILAAVMSKKAYQNSVFVIKKGDKLSLLTEQIKKILENETAESIIRFSIIYYRGHGCFGQFEIDKTNNPPIVRYAHIDPYPQLIEYSAVITNDFVSEISPLAHIEIGESALMMQKGASCTYFAMDGGIMLATPSNRDYVPNVMEHMKKNGTKMTHPFKEKNITYMRCPTLPARMMVGLHFIEDEPLFQPPRRGLYSLIFNSQEKSTIVNKKGETAETAIRKDLQGHFSTSNQMATRLWNMRIERKMKQYGKAVHDFIKGNTINVVDASFSSLLDQYSLKGLLEFCEEKINSKSTYKKN
ncbi:hypothetical protein [Legionella jamestowniensis]|nr:hypothetical protein [Legionella jamestowniensis]